MVYDVNAQRGRRTLTGAWIETLTALQYNDLDIVAPSRVRGLKLMGLLAALK